MDGNITSKEEEELVSALKDEMPDFFENVEANFDHITNVNQMIKQLQGKADAKGI